MIKILIVEDEFEKRRLLVETLLQVNLISINDIEHASDVFAAKKLIQRTRYDLVILDLNIPARADKLPEVGAGLDILRFVRLNHSAISPRYIVGMSAYDDAMVAAKDDFALSLWKLLKFSHTDLSWQSPLKQSVEYLIEQNRPPYPNDGRTYHTDLGIVVALEGEELEGLKSIHANWQQVSVPYDHSRYIRGTFNNGQREIDVVAVAAAKMGMPPAAVVASKLIHNFRPRYLAIVGICAGVRGKTNLGDILIADPCFDWGSGKWVRDADTTKLRFRPAPYPWRLDEALRSAAVQVSEIPGVIDKIYDSFEGVRPPNRPAVKIDAMASGGSVLQATELMDDVRDQHKNLVGVEMESYAVFTAAEYAADPRPECISIKAVCDFGDDEKSDDYHTFAAHASAHFLHELATLKLFNDS
ncbi:phosphorylase family protein [Noviherbaspirillum soli]|uniref:phosphorylase family protein n=1 Tax=Noviherbaspirillum soli TaxID=1064518 RepID=UPI00188AD811|nr:hypothetical protein [Noviherbaspirillum soli]